MIDKVILEVSKIMRQRNIIEEKLKNIGLKSNHESQKILINEVHLVECRYMIIRDNEINYEYHCTSKILKRSKSEYYIDYIKEERDDNGIYINLE